MIRMWPWYREALKTPSKILTAPQIRRIWANAFYVPGWRTFWERILQEGLP